MDLRWRKRGQLTDRKTAPPLPRLEIIDDIQNHIGDIHHAFSTTAR
jgi:hypothetical protein